MSEITVFADPDSTDSIAYQLSCQERHFERWKPRPPVRRAVVRATVEWHLAKAEDLVGY
jgi:hypothetical protein